MTNNGIDARLGALRTWMRERQIEAFIFTSSDPHNGEYVPDHWMGREWISGFNGSAGTAVVTHDAAALWTDSRYFIAAAQQLAPTEFVLMKERMPETPTIDEWLADQLKDPGAHTVGLDGTTCTAAYVRDMQQALSRHGDFVVCTEWDPLDTIWTDRPAIPENPVVVHPLVYAGEPAEDKLARIREAMAEQHADALLVSMLDDIAWTLNLRGTDIHCNPVFVSYLLVKACDAVLFVNPVKMDGAVKDYLNGIGVRTGDYHEVRTALAQIKEGVVWLDPFAVNHSLFQAAACGVLAQPSPIPAMKAVKNETEREGFRRAMCRDGVAMVRFLRWLKPAVERGGETEMSVARQLEALHAEDPLFRGVSFDTISAYAAHGAIVHYEPTEETDMPLRPEGLLLLDSGGQYPDGTTDITRTVALGPVTDEERRVYTLVLKAHIQLEMLKFPKGACGTQLDAVARKELWREGLNYLHGTGHGVGAYLNVHEGPHQIRMEYKPAPMVEGLTVTDEPGVYVEGRFGVRIENTLLVTPYINTPFGQFLQFESLTLCPIDLAPADLDLLTPEEVAWLDSYHQRVYDTLAPYLTADEQQWLRKNTLPVAK